MHYHKLQILFLTTASQSDENIRHKQSHLMASGSPPPGQTKNQEHLKHALVVRYKFLTIKTMNVPVYWNVTPFSLPELYRSFSARQQDTLKRPLIYIGQHGVTSWKTAVSKYEPFFLKRPCLQSLHSLSPSCLLQFLFFLLLSPHTVQTLIESCGLTYCFCLNQPSFLGTHRS